MSGHEAIVADTQDADFAEHVHTYHLFLNMMKYGAAGVIVILIILAFVTL